jgi:hypothetical protein
MHPLGEGGTEGGGGGLKDIHTYFPMLILGEHALRQILSSSHAAVFLWCGTTRICQNGEKQDNILITMEIKPFFATRGTTVGAGGFFTRGLTGLQE